jgi:anti-sigma factor RsiW
VTAAAACGRRFEEELLSGYLDRALTQGERQMVELHLERCAECRATVDELGALRGAARSSSFEVPADLQWSELPRTAGSRVLRLGGWLLLSLWAALVVAAGAIGVGQAAVPLWAKLVVAGGVAGIALLLLSVFVDRLRDLRHDRYDRVQK